MKQCVIVTVVDRGPDERLLRSHLDAVDLRFVLERVDPSGVLTRLEAGAVDFLFLPGDLGSKSCFDVLGRVRRSGYIGPLIICADRIRSSVAVGGLIRGADAFLIQEDMTGASLLRVMNYAEVAHRLRRNEAALDAGPG